MKRSTIILADEGVLPALRIVAIVSLGVSPFPRGPMSPAGNWIQRASFFAFVRRSNRFSRLAKNRNRCALRTKELSAPDVVKRWVSLLRTHTGHDVRRPCRCRRSCITFLDTRRGEKPELRLNQIRRKAIAVFRKENAGVISV